jgi:hypothetical protein
MPHYEFFCHACQKSFRGYWLSPTMRKTRCTNVEQRWSVFTAGRRRPKSAGRECPHCPIYPVAPQFTFSSPLGSPPVH